MQGQRSLSAELPTFASAGGTGLKQVHLLGTFQWVQSAVALYCIQALLYPITFWIKALIVAYFGSCIKIHLVDHIHGMIRRQTEELSYI